MLDGVMSTSFPQLNCPPIVRLINVSWSRIHFRTKVNPSMAILMSYALVSTKESRILPESRSITGLRSALTRCQTSNNSLYAHRNTVGVIAGLSAMSTLIFLEKMVCWSSRNEKDRVPFLLCNDPAIKAELLVHRGSVNGKLKVDNSSHRLIVENLRHKRVFFEQSGVKCIVMTCHMSGVWHSEISEGCSIPFLNVGDSVAQQIKEANLKPLEAGSKVRIGVLTTDATLVGGFYQEKLCYQGFECVLPDKPTMEHIVLPVVQAMKRKDTEGARNLLRIAIHTLLVRGVNAIILADDEFPGLLPHDDPLLKKCIDPMDALARSTIIWAQSQN